MTILLNLPPEQEERLRQAARVRGIASEALLQQIVAAGLERLEAAHPRQRVPGLHAGRTQISDEFDAPLPDSFWAGSG